MVTIIVFNNTTPSNNNPQTSIPTPTIINSTSINIDRTNRNLLWLLAIPLIIIILVLIWLAYRQFNKLKIAPITNDKENIGEDNKYIHEDKEKVSDQNETIGKKSKIFTSDGNKNLYDSLEKKDPIEESPRITDSKFNSKNLLSLNIKSEN